MRGVVAGVLQRFDEECAVDVGVVAGELTHLIGAAAVSVFVSHGQHLVGLQRGVERDVAQGGVDGVFRRAEQPGALNLLVVGAAHQSGAVEHRRGLVDVAGIGVAVDHRLILRVGGIGGYRRSGDRPAVVAHRGVLAEVGQRHNVAGVGSVARLVGHPDLHAVDGDAGGEVGQLAHARVVMVVEILREEEVAVLLVVGGVHLEGGVLLTALRTDALRRTLLLRGDQLQLEFAELHVGTQTEQTAGALDERGIGGERDVARLDELDNLILLAVVLQLHVLRIVVEGGVGVVVEVHVHLVAYLTVHAEVNLLVEVHRRLVPAPDG